MSNEQTIRAACGVPGDVRQRLSVLRENFAELLVRTRDGKLPPIGLIDRTQQNLAAYMEYLGHREEELKVSFENIKADGMTPDDVVRDICEVPEAAGTLMCLGLRKAAAPEDDGMDAAAVSRLEAEGYVRRISEKQDDPQPLFALTDKGLQCFRDAALRKKLSERSGMVMMPAALTSEAGAWDRVMLGRAGYLRQYYRAAGRGDSYLLFSLSEAPRLLMGCGISDEPGVKYSVAWVVDELTYSEEIRALQAFLASDKVDELTVVVDRRDRIGQVREKMNELACSKTELLYRALEDFHE